MAKYPEAKVILTERDAAAWYKSVKNSIFKFSQLEIPASAPPFMFEVAEMARTLVLDGAMAPDATGFFNDEERIQAMFIEHNKAIKALVPADRLLVMKTEEMSWEKLCPFLGKEIPDVPFPRANSTSELLQLVDALESKDKEFNINTFREQMNLSK
ncbi:hypothetical protein BCR43DRAFT_493336 [Syncephalastrum racemosum]|uniref:P-loop containing nucleoside triphosphate hydrolase protein n=1 Tax=Syncephalastrum racemosum TaxID=13706 RepID=A0A1X2HAH2_SYNRA|nr:hypothetical protein BCR43DRAFT_493336 [Syncephalastrum racemosum]